MSKRLVVSMPMTSEGDTGVFMPGHLWSHDVELGLPMGVYQLLDDDASLHI